MKKLAAILLSGVLCFNFTAPVFAADYRKPIPNYEIYDSKTDEFFKNSVFFGDSLMVGLRMYCRYKGSGFLSDPLFLAAESFSLYQATGPITETSLHPSYQGKKMSVEDAAAASGADKAFLFFGMNDLVWTSVDDTISEYNNLIFRIHYKNPDMKLYVIGATYIYGPGQKEGYTNAKMREFNDKMYEYCTKYDYLEFINIGDRLIDENGGLKAEYCSDNYVHMTVAGYDVWAKVLRAYADYYMKSEAAEAAEPEQAETAAETTSETIAETLETETALS